jgi:hypothetical protein
MAALAIELVIGLGGLLLTALFTPKKPDTYGSRLNNINVPSVSPGVVIPVVFGTMKVPAQMIFASPLIETMHTHQASKKGGGKGSLFGGAAKSFTFTYSVDAAWGICGGPAFQVNRIWGNQKLLYVNPVVAAHAQADFDAAYQSEATRLIDEEGVELDYAAASAFVFAFNNFDTSEVTLTTPSQAVTYILAHPIDDTLGITGMILTPDSDGVTAVIDELYSSLNNGNQYESQINRFDMIEVYLGSDEQGPNGLLEGYLGQGNAPAFRNCAYFVITNLQLVDFGNAVPQMTVEVQMNETGTTTLVEVMTSVCFQAGLSATQFDAASNVDDTPFPGFSIVANTSARDVITDLQKVFPIDAAESGFKVIFNMLNSRARNVIDRRDLAAHVDTEALPSSQEITIQSDYDLPQRINFKYQEPARSFSPNSLYAARYNTPSKSVEDLDVTIALDRSFAQTAVNNLLANRMLARRTYKMYLPRKYVGLEPTDAFKMSNKALPAYLDQYYCTQVNIGNNGLLEVTAVDHLYVDPALAPTDQVSTDLDAAVGGNTALPTTSQTVPFLYDIPLLTDQDVDGPGFYAVLAGAFNGWQGGSLYVDAASASISSAYGVATSTASSGSSWEAIAASTFNVPHGIVLDKLAPSMHACYWDRASVIHVRIANGMNLVSAAENDILSQPLNATIIGNEVVQYGSVTNLGNGMWRLANFLRGLRGTERLIDSHVAGETFVRLSSSINRIATTKAELNIDDSFQSISFGAQASTAVDFSFTDTGNSLRPYTVKVYRTFRDVDGDIEVDWYPRVRQNGQWLSGADVTIPANDTPETYSVDVCHSADPTTVVATYPITGALGGAFVYTSAQQVTDFGSAQGTIYLVIYMISTIVGRGFGKGVIV